MHTQRPTNKSEHNTQLKYWPLKHTTQIGYQIHGNWGIDIIHIHNICIFYAKKLGALLQKWMIDTLTYRLKHNREWEKND